MRREARQWDWVALMVDVGPDDLKTCSCEFPALFYVHPKEYRPGPRKAPNSDGSAVRANMATRMLLGNHLQDMLAPRH